MANDEVLRILAEVETFDLKTRRLFAAFLSNARLRQNLSDHEAVLEAYRKILAKIAKNSAGLSLSILPESQLSQEKPKDNVAFQCSKVSAIPDPLLGLHRDETPKYLVAVFLISSLALFITLSLALVYFSTKPFGFNYESVFFACLTEVVGSIFLVVGVEKVRFRILVRLVGCFSVVVGFFNLQHGVTTKESTAVEARTSVVEEAQDLDERSAILRRDIENLQQSLESLASVKNRNAVQAKIDNKINSLNAIHQEKKTLYTRSSVIPSNTSASSQSLIDTLLRVILVLSNLIAAHGALAYFKRLFSSLRRSTSGPDPPGHRV